MASRRKYIRLEEAIGFALNSNNSDCDTPVGGPVMKKMILIAN